MSFNNRWNNRDEKVKVWNTVTEKVPGENAYVYTIICPRCNGVALKYKDGTKLKPKEVTHCGVTETFYIAEEIAV